MELATHLMLTHIFLREVMYLYMVVYQEAVSIVLIRESNSDKNPIYFILKALVGPKLLYQKI